ncbi:hypothetical protein OH76DRAFT_1490166 [Lentinus brumalis]|uniref:Uncharacterized protein n=1 Tax=Lentinus brumalis TaxID=2498619 RepID=A0A371CJX2_9APHY|nr:hypothetical protein OH76DRAFT_1490166 [Polyporus brumalis]
MPPKSTICLTYLHDFHYFPCSSSSSERHPPVHTARLRYLDENGPRPRPTFLG